MHALFTVRRARRDTHVRVITHAKNTHTHVMYSTGVRAPTTGIHGARGTIPRRSARVVRRGLLSSSSSPTTLKSGDAAARATTIPTTTKQRRRNVSSRAVSSSLTATTTKLDGRRRPQSGGRGRFTTTTRASGARDETGENAAIVNTVKAIFGAGGFALPWAFAQGGLLLVGTCMVASLAFALESLRMLIKSQDVLVASGEATAADVATYAGLTKQAMGSVGDVVCRVMNVVTCFGITISYLIFIAETCKVVVPALVGAGPFGAAPTTASMLQLIAPAMIGLSWLREMSGVAVISAVGTASVVIGMLVTTIDALGNPLQIAALPTWNFAAFPGFFGTVAFLFFIHFTLFGIKEAMPQPDKFFPAAVKAFTGAAAIAAVFGIAGAVGYGTSVSSVVVTMLSGPSGIAVQLLLCLNLMSTYPIMAQSALRICEDLFKGKSGSIATPTSIGVRTAFTAGALWTAANVPNFGVVLGYVGGVCCSILSLVLPATILYIAQNKVKNEITANELARIATVFVTGITCIVLSLVL